jgi:NAD(P)-dependent dehydrogenase (short-subunit alcohol dehydrogenase family)
MPRFTNQIALISGATSGIGRATALAFAREGAKVVAAGRRTTEGQALVKEIEASGGNALFVQTDVAHEDQVKSLIAKTLATFGRLDIAINNAGIEGDKFKPLTEQTVENFHAVMNCNVLGVMLCLKHQIPAMQKQQNGVIVNVASVAGVLGSPDMSVYSASKHAVIGLTRAAAMETAKQGIRVNSVSPGIILTEMYDRFTTAGATLELANSFHPMGRVGKVEEIASTILFLSSPESSFITGANLMADGGWSVP